MVDLKKKNQKIRYLVKVEGLVPATIEYDVLAENEEEAFKIVDKFPAAARIRGEQFDRNRILKKKVSVKDLLTGMINYVRHL